MSMQVTFTVGSADLDQHQLDRPQNGPTSTIRPLRGRVNASCSSVLSSLSGIQPGIFRLYGIQVFPRGPMEGGAKAAPCQHFSAGDHTRSGRQIFAGTRRLANGIPLLAPVVIPIEFRLEGSRAEDTRLSVARSFAAEPRRMTNDLTRTN